MNPFALIASTAVKKWQDRKDEKRQRGHVWNQTVLGNEMDLQNQKEMFDYRIDQGLSHGLTTWEMFLGPAGGAGGGTTNSGQTLGNAANEQIAQTRANKMQMQENAADRATALAQTQMQTNAQTKTAQIAANATTGAAQISAAAQNLKTAIEEKRLALDTRNFEEVILPQASIELDISKEQLEQQINATAQSTPEWNLMMKRLTMGMDNLMVEFVVKTTGIDPTDQKSIDSASLEERKKFLMLTAALSSTAYKEAAGLAEFYGKQTGLKEGLGNALSGTEALGREIGGQIYQLGNGAKGSAAVGSADGRTGTY